VARTCGAVAHQPATGLPSARAGHGALVHSASQAQAASWPPGSRLRGRPMPARRVWNWRLGAGDRRMCRSGPSTRCRCRPGSSRRSRCRDSACCRLRACEPNFLSCPTGKC
jgi:hypothetical protein